MPDTNDHAVTASSKSPRSAWKQRIAVIIAMLVLATVLVRNRETISMDSLIRQQDALRHATTEQPLLVLGSAFVLYVVVTGLSLPGAALMTLVYGWLFDFWQAIVLVSFASTAGATIAFLLSRFLFRDAIQARFRDRLVAFNEALAREGAFYLFTLRLIPQIPFFLVNLVMGLTPIRTTTFWWVSQAGMLPGTCVYVYAGASIGGLDSLRARGLSGIVSWQLALAFALLGLFPWIVKRLMTFFTNQPAAGPGSLTKGNDH